MGVPIQLSIVLDNYYAAIGNVYMEPTFGTEYQYLNIKMVNNMIMFQSEQHSQQGGILKNTNRKVEKITLYNYKTPFVSSESLGCGITRDMEKVIDLQIVTKNTTQGIYEIMPLNAEEEIDLETMHFITLGFDPDDKVKTCAAALKNMYSLNNVKNDTRTFYAELQPNYFAGQRGQIYSNINVTLLTDNSISVKIDQVSGSLNTVDNLFFDNDFSQYNKTKPSFNLSDALTYNENPFYIEIYHPVSKKLLYSTKDQIVINDNFIKIWQCQISSNEGRVWGLGERDGDLLIGNSTRISLWSNNQNLPSETNEAYTTFYGKNGFFPMYFSQINGTNTSISVINFNQAAQDYVFYHSPNGDYTNVTNIMA